MPNCDLSPTNKHVEVVQKTGGGTAVGICKYCLVEMKRYDDIYFDKTHVNWRDFKLFPRSL